MQSEASLRMAELEYAYWSGVLEEDPMSAGGRLGSAFDPQTRDWLQRNIFNTSPN